MLYVQLLIKGVYMKNWLLTFLFMFAVVSSVHAQTELTVPFATSSFAWDPPVVDVTHSAPTRYVITCGTIISNVPAPATSILIRSVVPGPGTYDCTIYAQNAFGNSPEPNPSFPHFTAGNPPGVVGNLRLVVTP